MYFVRYNLGGPHIRLRWRLVDQSAEAAAVAALAEHAHEFFARYPSTNAWSEYRVREANAALLGVDPLAQGEDDQVFPDNSWRAAPLGFEIERYGGPTCFQRSLDLFTLSSTSVLQALRTPGGVDAGELRLISLRLILHLAWGLVGNDNSCKDRDRFFELVRYAPTFMGEESYVICLKEADALFTRKRDQLRKLVQSELLGGAGPGQLSVAAGQFSTALTGVDDYKRWYIAASHIHMTANRLGLNNAQEVYLSQILWRAVECFHEERPEEWTRAFAAIRPEFIRRSHNFRWEEALTSALATLIT
jgi:hypothetical protein